MGYNKVTPDNVRMFGGDDDYVAVGPAMTEEALEAIIDGLTEFPVDAPASHEEVGWLGPDGIAWTPSDSVTKITGHQGGRTIRTKMTASDTTFKFRAMESTLLTVGLAMGIKKSEKLAAGGGVKHRIGGRQVEKRSFLIGLTDGETKWLLCIPHGEIGERAEIQMSGSAETGYELTSNIIKDAFLVTWDDEGMTPGGVEGRSMTPEGDDPENP